MPRVLSNKHLIEVNDEVRFPFKTGIYAFKQGNKKMSQKLMRGRVAAQGFTILVMTAGLYMAGPPEVCGEKVFVNQCHTLALSGEVFSCVFRGI